LKKGLIGGSLRARLTLSCAACGGGSGGGGGGGDSGTGDGSAAVSAGRLRKGKAREQWGEHEQDLGQEPICAASAR
jgi:hypothetical protein